MNHFLIKLVRFYQIILSVFLGQHCRFHPTCSNYAIEALKLHGALKGTILSSRRICKCHPWSAGGVDEVPGK